MAETIKLPTEVIDSDWKDDIAVDYEPFENESKYQNNIPDGAELIDRKEVKNATLAYKNRKIGRVALFSSRDKLAA